MKIGLTGSIACGKSTVSAYIRQLGYPVVDADALSHALTAPNGKALPALREAFGDGIFDGNVLDRRALSRIVFADSTQRARLNALLHPMILAELRAQLALLDAPDRLVFGDVPLLYECGMARDFDRIWVVYALPETQLARLMARDRLSEAEARQRIAAQMPLEEKIRLADAVIDTDGPLERTRRQVHALLASAQRSYP